MSDKQDDKQGNKQNGKSFWTTVPGLLTGCAALITAIGGFITVLVTTGVLHLSPLTPTVISTPVVPRPTDTLSIEVTPATTPSACITAENVDATQVVSISPPTGTSLKVGQTYTFTMRVKYQLKTRQEAFLELSIYSFNEEGLGRSGDNAVKVNMGCEVREIALVQTITDHGQTNMKLAVVLRVDEYTLLSDWGFSDPFPVSR